MRDLVILGLLVSVLSAPAAAQTKPAPQTAKPTTKKPLPPPPPRKMTIAPAEIACPAPLGIGVASKQSFCDVLTGRDPKAGILVKLPPHRGTLLLRFKLHNRHTYSEEEVKKKQAYASYTATIGVLTLDNTLITRAVVSSEFRNRNDLVDRISGGVGPGGVKAVAPVGTEDIVVELPADVTEVSILGEKLNVVRLDGEPANYSAIGRPIAIISEMTVEYTPVPAAPVRRRR